MRGYIEVAMIVFRRTWLPTVLFLLVSTVVWWRLVGWSIAGRQLLPTLLFAPVVWWFVVGRRTRPHLFRGVVGGAITGFVTQSAQDIPKAWGLLSRRGTFVGDDQAVAMVSFGVYLSIGVCATALGALVGLVAVAVQRRVEGRGPIS
jgi:hypothetical protein